MCITTEMCFKRDLTTIKSFHNRRKTTRQIKKKLNEINEQSIAKRSSFCSDGKIHKQIVADRLERT